MMLCNKKNKRNLFFLFIFLSSCLFSFGQNGTITFSPPRFTGSVNGYIDGSFGSTDIPNYTFNLFSGNKNTGIGDGTSITFDDLGTGINGVSPYFISTGSSALIFKETGGNRFSFQGFSILDLKNQNKNIVVESFRSGVSVGSVTIPSSSIPNNGPPRLLSPFGISTFTSNLFGNIDEIRVYASDGSNIFHALNSFIVAATPPTITSFSPASAKPGDVVTITGTNFNTTPANNIVFFGATKATVSAATATQLTVTVPAGATYGPITELNTGNGLACYGLSNFNPIYSPAKTAISTTDFSTKVDFTTGLQPYTVAIGDLDGDGKPDLVVANFDNNSVSVFKNTSTSGSIGNGSFATKQDFTTGSQAISVSIGDLDGDGKSELVVANFGQSTVSVFRNTSSSGTISFDPKQDFTTGASPRSIAIGDLDGDGKLDLAVANNGFGVNSLSVLHNTSNTGTVSFATKVDFGTGTSPASIAIGDLDGDGKPDLAVGNLQGSTVSIFRNTSTTGIIVSGSFAPKVDLTTGFGPISVSIGDLDGDGKPDLAVVNASSFSNSVSVFRNTFTTVGIVSFAPKVDFATGAEPYTVAIGDFDGNGKPDLAVANFGNGANTVSVLRNTSTNGSVNFAGKQDFTVGTSPRSIAIGDLDGDGKPDLVASNGFSSSMSILRNTDLPPTITSFTPASAKPGDVVTITGTGFNTTATNNVVFFGATKATVSAATPTQLTVTLPTGATYAPITVLNTGTSLAAYSRSNFNPIYTPSKTSITTTDFSLKQDFTAGDSPFSVAIGDLDGDGKPDLAVANLGSNTVSVYRNISTSGSIGSGSFAPKVDFTTGSTPYSVAIGDIDGDGKQDLALANSNSSSVSVLRNTFTTIGTVSFAAKVDFATGSTPRSVAIGDLDGDGKLDLAVANFVSNTLSVLRNISSSGSIVSGSFETKVDFTTGTSPTAVAIGDIDGDGKPDLAAANANGVSVSIFRNTSTSGIIGSGSFAPKVDLTTGTSPFSVAIGDLDGDGKPELTVSNFASSSVSVFRNTFVTIGTVSFAAKVDFSTGGSPFSVAIGDLDGDGKPDLATANQNSTSVSVLRNIFTTSGTVSFAAKVDFTTGTAPRSVAIGDLDGDGRPDLAVTNSSSTSVSIFRNSDPPPPPTITSFSPASAKPTEVVTITGTNFNSTTTNNVVFFGATRANVVTATATQLTVTVPSGATYAPITVLNTGTSLAAYSLRNFNPIYSPAKTAFTTTDFSANVDFATTSQANFVAIGDLDGDGKPDMLAANFFGQLSVYRNISTSGSIGTSSFAAKVDFPFSGQNLSSLAIGDVDGDGKPDVAVTVWNSSTVTLLRNTSTSGTISFAARQDFTTGTGPESVAIGDIDGDGKPDLAVANQTSNNVSVFRNTSTIGTVGFATKVDFGAGSTPKSVSIGDLDEDGKPDLAVANNGSANISVLRNTSTSGTVSFATKVDFGAGTTPSSVAIGDLDGDGKPDLAVANQGSTSVSIFRNTFTTVGIVSFASKVDFGTGNSPISVSIGDLDGDGKPDLAVANNGAATASVLRNTSTSGSIVSGSFSTKVDFGAGSTPRSVAIGDLDGDGRPDLAVGNYVGASVSVLRNADPIPVPTITSFTPTSAKPGDVVTIIGTGFNTTAANNIVFFGATKATVSAATATQLTVTVPSGATYAPISELNTGNKLACYSISNFNPIYSPAKATLSSFDFASKVDLTSTGTNTKGAVMADLDGDGKSELIVANISSSSISVFRNISSFGTITANSFATKVDFTVGAFAESIFTPLNIAIGDLDGDGKPDLAITNSAVDGVSVLRNTSTSGTISFASNLIISTGSSARPINASIGDLDGDGKPDLALSIEGNGFSSVTTLRNTSTTGNISFGTRADLAIAGSAISLATGDIDGDGKLDLVGTKAGEALVFVFRNTSLSGNINFATRVDIVSGNRPQSIVVGDLDGDGKLDLVTANRFSNNVTVLQNTSTTGNITFATKVDFAAGTEPFSVAIGDLDGDSKPDLAVSSRGDFGLVFVFKNTSTAGPITSGSFSTKIDINAGLTEPVSMKIGDLDGDGRPDLAITSDGNRPFGVIQNIIPPTIITTGTLAALTTTYGTASSNTSFSVSGTSLTTDLVVTAPTGFEVSTSTTTGFGASVSLPHTGGAVSATTIYVRLKASNTVAASPYTGNVVCTSTNAPTVNVPTVSSSVTAKALTITGVTANNKLLDGNTTATLSGTPVLNGIVGTDNVTVTGTPVANFASSTVGNSIAVTVTGYTLGGTAAGNYTVTQPTGLTANIFSSLITSTGTLTALTTTYGTASSNTSFTVSGSNLTADLVVNAPTGFQVSTSSTSGFGTSVTLPHVGGTVATTTIFVRLSASTNVGNYSGNVVLSSTGASNVNVPTVSSSVAAKALTITGLTANNKLLDGNTTATLSGTAILNGVVGSENVVLGGTPVATFASSTVGNNIAVTVTGYTISGTAISNYTLTQPTGLTANIFSAVITLTGSLNAFTGCISTGSVAQSFTVSGTDLLGNITLTAPTGYELSATATGTYNSSINVTATNGTVASTTVFVRLNSSVLGTVAGNIVATSSEAANKTIAATGTVTAFTTIPAIAGLQQLCFLSTTTFTNATAGGVWSSGNTTAATISTAGVITGRQAGVATISYTVTTPAGCVSTATRDITINPLPIITATATPSVVYKGQNTQLGVAIVGNVPSTYAWSPAGNITSSTQPSTSARVLQNTIYTLTATSAQGCVASSNVSVTTREDAFVEPVNVFTPNGDGINDRFVIKNLDAYPVNKLQVFDRTGKVIYEQNNYANTWDGYINGKLLTKDTYFYILTVNGAVVKKATITLLR